jgi:putative DNA primase/helicase
MNRIFKSSGLYRNKWDEKHFSNGDTYGQRTIQTAMNSCRQTYKARNNVDYNDDDGPG